MEERLNRKIKFCKVCGKVVFEDFRRIHPECLKGRQRQLQKKWYKKKRKALGITTRYKSHHRIATSNDKVATKPSQTLIIIDDNGKARTFKLMEGN
jgi:hypothetical protein